jgi:serine/threonine protein kinase
MDEQNQSKSNDKDQLIGKVLFNKYLLVKKLGEGSFGSIYSAKENNNWYAIKFENKNKSQNLLENEAYIMSYLGGPRIPGVKSFGYSGDYNVLIMELMGKSLEDLFESLPNKKMSIRCVCNLGYQMIEIMEYIHNKHIIHRDIKPDNFVMGKGNKRKYLYLLDFGLSKKYRSSSTLKHYPLIKRKKLTGTARYASVNALKGITQSRRDDLEAIGYVLMYFLIGRLPWQGMVNKDKDERYLRIMEVKRDTTPEKLCQGFPLEFETYVSYTRNLEYEQDPDYSFLKNLFLKVLRDEGYNFDYYYDWDNDSISMTTADTCQNFICKNELNKELEKNFEIKPLNDGNLEEENEIRKNKIKLNNQEINIIVEEKENNEKKDKSDNKEENVINDVNKNINEDKIEENILEEVKINNVNNNNNNGKKNENEEIKLDLNITEEGKPANKVRRHEKYAFCGYKNDDNKCCIII